ncbi:MAG: peptidoglycan DD-metalloendopeptidase family protein [Actinomycetota bacterium]|nr:peptidoglycan DD-metalloendopeptidase family protein [Actinomycetota bacterium]
MRAPKLVGRASVATLVSASILAALPGLPVAAAESDPLQKELDATAAAYGRLETQLADTEAKQVKLSRDLANADRILAEQTRALKARAGYMYKKGGVSAFLGDLLTAPNLGVFIKRIYYLERLGGRDTEIAERLRITQKRADIISAQLEQARARQVALLERLREKRLQLEAKFKGLKVADNVNKVSRAGKFASFSLPIGGPTAFANSWGARRSGGRRHKGTDVMAPCGAPVIAVTDGIISNLHSGGNGGIMAYLRADNGDVFFYAHLRRYAPEIANGMRVTTGDLIGYNGNTGNARGGPCHVHFEWHPRGGGPVNPYSLLAAAR